MSLSGGLFTEIIEGLSRNNENLNKFSAMLRLGLVQLKTIENLFEHFRMKCIMKMLSFHGKFTHNFMSESSDYSSGFNVSFHVFFNLDSKIHGKSKINRISRIKECSHFPTITASNNTRTLRKFHLDNKLRPALSPQMLNINRSEAKLVMI
jgi:hypothetical protein